MFFVWVVGLLLVSLGLLLPRILTLTHRSWVASESILNGFRVDFGSILGLSAVCQTYKDILAMRPDGGDPRPHENQLVVIGQH